MAAGRTVGRSHYPAGQKSSLPLPFRFLKLGFHRDIRGIFKLEKLFTIECYFPQCPQKGKFLFQIHPTLAALLSLSVAGGCLLLMGLMTLR